MHNNLNCRIFGHKKMLFGHDEGGHGGGYHFRCDKCGNDWDEILNNND